MNVPILISGYGSIGRRHTSILSQIVKKKNITVLTRQKSLKYKTINKMQESLKINPNYIVLCNPTTDHLKKILFIEKNFKNKTILVEKPLFHKPNNIQPKKNKYFVGYNLRFNPVIELLKKKIKSKKIWSVNIFCGSYLPNWRKNIDYRKSSSAKRKFGGGVLLDLSHELDYVQWLFGKIKIENCKSTKLSNLEIDTDDFLNLNCKTKSVPSIQITLNYFSKIPKRHIYIDGKDISIHADLINNKVEFSSRGKRKIYNFKNFEKNFQYKKQHLAILKGKNSHQLCKYNDGKEIVNLIQKIRNKSKINE